MLGMYSFSASSSIQVLSQNQRALGPHMQFDSQEVKHCRLPRGTLAAVQRSSHSTLGLLLLLISTFRLDGCIRFAIDPDTLVLRSFHRRSYWSSEYRQRSGNSFVLL